MTESRRLSGIAASAGIAIAPVRILNPVFYDIDGSVNHDSEYELARYAEAQKAVCAQIELMKKTASEIHDEWVTKIFDSHLFLVGDPELQDNVTDLIKETGVSAEYALLTVRDPLVSMLEALDDPSMSERAADLRDVTDRMIAELTGQPQTDLSLLTEETIIAAVELSPLETSRLDRRFVKGILTEKGGYSCHTAIMARSGGIPAVTGVCSLLSNIKQGMMLIVDGSEGEIIIEPRKQELSEANRKVSLQRDEKQRLEKFITRETRTRDGFSIEIGAHLGNPDELDAVIENGADGIGLFRTEFLLSQDSGFPAEQQQFEIYRKVLEVMAPKPVVIRTMDIGGDKQLPYTDILPEDNPFLGLRGIRYSLKHQDLFRIQLRALLRAAPYGRLRIMFPMVATVDELLAAKALLLEEKSLLNEEQTTLTDNIEIGVMIEVPSAALIAEALAPHVDFFSIGTNDLVQYTMAADRMNEQVSHLYQPLHPAVLKLIKMVTAAAAQNSLWTGVCGELAGDPEAVPVLLGLGVTELSVAAPVVASLRELISRYSLDEMNEKADAALRL